jgi:hypothetical protein
MIKMVLDINHPRGEPDVWCPRIVCDWCGEPIERVAEGNDEWRVEPDGVSDGALAFTHKRCCHAFETANGGGPCWYAEEISLFPLYLGRDLAVDELRTRRVAALRRMTG